MSLTQCWLWLIHDTLGYPETVCEEFGWFLVRLKQVSVIDGVSVLGVCLVLFDGGERLDCCLRIHSGKQNPRQLQSSSKLL